MPQSGPDDRRDEDGELASKYGNTLIRTLRKAYGPAFAPGHADGEKLSHALPTLDPASLERLVHDHEQGRLEARIGAQTHIV